MSDSLNTHGALTERSHTDSLTTPIGKGREGKGRDVGHLALPSTEGAPRQCDKSDDVVWVMPREDARDLLAYLHHNRPLGMPDSTFDGLMDALDGLSTTQLTAELAATKASLAAARNALAAVREVREKKAGEG